MGLRKKIWYSALISGAVLVCGGVKYAISCLHTSTDYIIDIDARLSENMRTTVHAYILDTIQYRSVKSWCAHLKKQFPYIASIAVTSCVPHITHIHVDAKDPWYAINHEHIVLNDGMWLSKSVYAPHVYALLESLNVRLSPNKISVDIQNKVNQCITQLPRTMLNTWVLSFIDEMHIILHDKQQPHFSILCSAIHMPNEVTAQQCALIKNELEERNVFTLNKKKQWVADVRFENQIIVFADTGGYYDGTGIF